ncbi:MAG: undecaprenyl/decaprenyl-phosphate alpha-N-acetylglucosaminyl 1-phosphate transferase [Anaerolineae bacterium]|nr:undecaprenyl/decaprenyl-phosphate alpha-N-acetylglucosaminyl 1-phosphate transferase [Anaerolineae bacterium]
MTTLVLIFATALVFALGATPLARLIALRADVVDRPNARKIHATPMPRLGGVAMYGAFIVALILFADRFYVSQMISILVGATWVSFLGLWDDRVGLAASWKLIGQIAGALILVLTGVSVELFPYAPLNIAITVLWVVGITNALNLLDNMDGLSGGVAAIAAGFFLLIAALNGQYLVAMLSAALLGAALGFLVYNFNPARIFMGDAGSLFLGFLLAAVGIKLRFLHLPVIATWFIPILVLGVPIFDTTLVVISRLRRGVNPLTTPGTDHTSHRLVARGLTRRAAVVRLYLVASALGIAAVICAHGNVVINYAVLTLAAIVGLVALCVLEWQQK